MNDDSSPFSSFLKEVNLNWKYSLNTIELELMFQVEHTAYGLFNDFEFAQNFKISKNSQVLLTSVEYKGGPRSLFIFLSMRVFILSSRLKCVLAYLNVFPEN